MPCGVYTEDTRRGVGLGLSAGGRVQVPSPVIGAPRARPRRGRAGGVVVSDVAIAILSWEPGARRLEYVEVNGGLGGAAIRRQLNSDQAAQLAKELEGFDLPRLADLMIESGEVLVIPLAGPPLTRCSVKAVGPPHAREFELKARGVGVVATVPAAGLGIEDAEFAAAAQTLEFLYDATRTPPGCWLGCEGDIRQWLERKKTAKDEAEAKREAARKKAEEAERADRTFINPYTFVPLPQSIARCKPAGHHRLADKRLSGTFTVTWEFTSPFQAPEGASGTTRLRLPGSSVKGAVRSLHEALAGGCLRIFDEDFIPSYRDAAAVRSENWTLAVVGEATKDGQPLKVELCSEVVWVDAHQLRQACNGSLATGSRVTIRDRDVPPKPNNLGRKELSAKASVEAGGDWVVLVTSAGTRSNKTGTYFLACGKLGKDTAEVTENAWRTFRVAVAGADDLRKAVRATASSNPNDPRPTEPVTFDSQPIGDRRLATGRLWLGDVIWVRTRNEGPASKVADELSLAAIWRHPGWRVSPGQEADREKWSAKKRIPDDLRACDNPAWLCPSCRVFGSADQNARGRDDRAEQRAYAGHVRFGDACSKEPVKLESIRRAPLGAPRPGAGQLYLAYSDRSPARDRDSRPTREWGSDPDIAERRRLRGRKFYWHANPARQSPPRHIARRHQKEAKLAVDRWIAPPGTQLTQRVSFDNLSQAELGGLLASLEPQRVLPGSAERDLRLHLGGGKPLGLGSCFATVSHLRVWTAASRYGGAAEIQAEGDTYLAEFKQSCPHDVTGTWPALGAVLADNTVDAGRVWYPPGAYWSDRAAKEKPFDEPFAFFTASSGMYLKGKVPRSLIPLPDPAAEDQSIQIVRKADLE